MIQGKDEKKGKVRKTEQKKKKETKEQGLIDKVLNLAIQGLAGEQAASARQKSN